MPTITFRRDANITSASIPVVDGQILFDTATHQLFMDSGSERYQYGGSVEIVSTTPAARADNVYSALASNQIFLQKTTTVDSKSNALAVTQSYIPLGCLAFKETIGTTNFSSIGSTVSSALVALGNRTTAVEGKVSTIENELTANNKRIYMDYQGGKYGYNTSANRGADTFHPFNSLESGITSVWAANIPNSYAVDKYQVPVVKDDWYMVVTVQMHAGSYAHVENATSYSQWSGLDINCYHYAVQASSQYDEYGGPTAIAYIGKAVGTELIFTPRTDRYNDTVAVMVSKLGY